MSVNNPIISFLVLSRYRSDKINLITMLDSAMKEEAFTDIDREKIEFLVKIDNDDEQMKKQVLPRLSSYPFKVRTFSYRRWEGRWASHYHYDFLFCHRHENSRLTCFISDDVLFHQFSPEILPCLEENLNRNYSIFYRCKNNYPQPIGARIKPIVNYRENTTWAQPSIVEPYPIVSNKILEICGRLFEHVDGWIALLAVILYHKYGLSVLRELPRNRNTFIRDNLQLNDIRYDDREYLHQKFNNDMLVADCGIKPRVFDIAEQQARSIYLNMREDGQLTKYMV